MNRRHLIIAAAGATIGSHRLSANAQGKPIQMVVGFAPGGSIDLLARSVAEHLQSDLRVPVIVDNRTGAAGRVAVEFVKKAAADGNTLLAAPQGPMTLFPFVFRRLGYDAVNDFVPISRMAAGDFALTIGPLVPAKDLAGFRGWLKSAGDKANYGSPGAGTVPHFVGVTIARQLGTPMTHVPYRGSVLAINDVAGGQIAAAVTPLTEALELHKAGRIHVVATTGSERSPFVQGVPTFKENGVDVEAPLWFAIFAPAGTPTERHEQLRRSVHGGLATTAFRERADKLGLVPAPSTVAELRALQQREMALWKSAVELSGFKPED